jgi:hypothetical protein|tara:strand:+ start:204 stop:668 length:465 start_codon:yes stop_codon:yes gene_type:complete
MKNCLIAISLLTAPVLATDLVFNFNSPSFNGIGQSAHYLTIDEQERSRKATILEEIESKANDLLREQENTTLAKFVRNLESRIFSQLSRDLAESLFNSETGGTGGVFDLEGNSIAFVNTGTEIILTVTDTDGSITEIRIPVGSFGICSTDECAS